MSSRAAIPVAETPRLRRSTISLGDFRWDGDVGTNIERLRNFGKKFVERLGRSVRPLLSSHELAEIHFIRWWRHRRSRRRLSSLVAGFPWPIRKRVPASVSTQRLYEAFERRRLVHLHDSNIASALQRRSCPERDGQDQPRMPFTAGADPVARSTGQLMIACVGRIADVRIVWPWRIDRGYWSGWPAELGS